MTGDEHGYQTSDEPDRMTGERPGSAAGDEPGRQAGERPRSAAGADRVRLTAWVSGQVQGVGFRWWTRSQALRLSLVGSASNLADGRVEVVAEGSRSNCERLAELLQSPDTPGQVDHVATRYGEPRGGLTGFRER